MNILLNLLLCLVPLLFELSTEGYRTIVLGRRDKHFITGSIRFGLMVICALALEYPGFWGVVNHLLLQVTFHFAFFNYLFNFYILKQRLRYLGNNFLDRIQKPIPWLILLGLRVILLVIGVIIVIYNR